MATGVCKDCSSACLEAVPDSCIVWTGESFPVLNIVKGNAYSTNIINLARELEKLVKASANLHCLWDNCGTPIVDLPTAVQALIDKICSLTTDDIASTANLFCISGAATGVEAAPFIGKESMITTAPTATGGNFSYDLNSVVTGLPENYSIQKVNVVLRGEPSNGNSLVGSSNSSQGIISIPNTRYPILADIDIRVNAPSGVIQLSQSIAITSSSTKINSPYPLSIVDYGGTGTAATKLTAGISAMASQICDNKTNINTLQSINITDTTHLKFPSKKRDAVVGVIVANLSDTMDKVSKPGDFQIFYRLCDDSCGDSVLQGSLQEVLDGYGRKICELVSTVNQLIIKTNILEQRLQVCCSDSFDSSSDISGGSGITLSGVCVGGGCGK